MFYVNERFGGVYFVTQETLTADYISRYEDEDIAIKAAEQLNQDYCPIYTEIVETFPKLEEFDEYCRKHNFKYKVVGSTALLLLLKVDWDYNTHQTLKEDNYLFPVTTYPSWVMVVK